MLNDEVVEKYRKVQKLAAQGDAGEAKAAAKAAERLEEKHPGIREAAEKAERREALHEKMRGFGLDPESMSFDDSTFYDLFEKAEDAKDGKGTFAERMFFKAVGWAVESLGESGVFRSTEPKEPPARPKSVKPDSIEGRLYEEIDIYDALAGESDEGEEVIEIHFALPADLWDRAVRSKGAATTLLKVLDKAIEDSFEDDEDDEDTGDEDDE